MSGNFQAVHRLHTALGHSVVGFLFVASTACSSSTVHDPPTVDTATPATDISSLTSDMLIGESAFPKIDGARWEGPRVDENGASGGPVTDPADCRYLRFGPSTTKAVSGTWSAPDQAIVVKIGLTDERPDLKNVLTQCGQFTVRQTNARTTAVTTTDVPNWAVVFQAEDSVDPSPVLIAIGIHRGASIQMVVSKEGGASVADTSVLSELLKEQAAIIDAA